MKTRHLCVGVMMTGISLMAFSCSKQDNDEILNNSASKAANPPAAVPAGSPAAAPAGPGVNWKAVGTNFFSVQVPMEWTLKELGAMDTYTGMISNGTNTMNYEYGKQHKPYYIDQAKFTYTYERIDGKMAKIIRSHDGGQYGICIDSVKVMTDNSGNVTRVTGFMLMSKQAEKMDEATAMTILRSVTFK